MGADPLLAAVADGSDLEVGRLHRLERLLDPAQSLVGQNDVGGGHPLFRHVGPNHAEPVQGRLGGYGLLSAPPEEGFLCDPQIEMLARPLLDQQCEDPVASVWLEVLVNARLRSHAAVSDEHRPLQSEAGAELADPGGRGGGVGCVPGERLESDRPPLGVLSMLKLNFPIRSLCLLNVLSLNAA